MQIVLIGDNAHGTSNPVFCTSSENVIKLLTAEFTRRVIKVNTIRWLHNITKTCLYNFDPFKPHFYIVKQRFTWVYIIFLILLKKPIYCRYSLEPPCRSGSNEYPQSMF